MAFTEDSLRAKLASLNETQDSISTVGQWILFHRRHADTIAKFWQQRVKDCPPNKRLTLIYLANEIAQQAKIRKKNEFLAAFDPIIAEGSSVAYKGSGPDIQNKIRRVIEVWRQRSVFRPQIQDEIERALNEIDRSRTTRKPALGGSLFSSSTIPPSIKPLEPFAIALQKADITTKPALATAKLDYDKLTNPNNPVPTAPVHAGALGALLKKLAQAESAVSDSIKARKELVTGLEKLLETNRGALGQEEAQLAELTTRKIAIDSRKHEVEDAIIRGLSAADQNAISTAPLPTLPENSQVSHERPQIEELTPPPMESFTPVGSPTLEPTADVPKPLLASLLPPPSVPAPFPAEAFPGADLLRSLTQAQARQNEAQNGGSSAYGGGQHGPSSAKKRKMSRGATEDEFAAFAADDEMKGIDSNLGDLI